MRTSVRRLVATVAGAAALAIGVALPASADIGSPPFLKTGVVPPIAAEFATGKTYGEWSAAWWQYVAGQPTPTNPFTTGVNCAAGQDPSSSPVFFLVGSLTSDPVTRTCTVPAGKFLFFPLITVFNANNPGEDRDARDLWRQLRENFGPTSELFASIDGVPVRKLDPSHTPYRACAGPVLRCSADPFSLTLPEANIFGAPAGVYEPAVADGYYLLLRPLSPGTHTITFGGTSSYFGAFSQDITYHLTVA